jgi:hypothetical protein
VVMLICLWFDSFKFAISFQLNPLMTTKSCGSENTIRLHQDALSGQASQTASKVSTISF